MKFLLGKSSDTPDAPRGEELLVGHTQLVMEAATSLLDHVGRPTLAAVGLDESETGRLRSVVLLAAMVHDLGKCSEHFQKMVRSKGGLPQLFRHEAVSAWLCWPSEGNVLAAWLREAVASDTDLLIAILAAAGHHRKFPDRSIQDEGAGIEMNVLCAHADFRRLLETCGKRLGLKGPPPLQNKLMRSEAGPGAVADIRQVFPLAVDDHDLNERDRRLLGVAKALVICADVAGSALPKTEKKVSWVSSLLTLRSTGGLDSLVARRLGSNALRTFQQRVADSKAAVTLVKAGCGSGKTVAAWAWGARQHRERQFWLCYPTTGTTTEGYRDYVEGADIHGFIEHGRARTDVRLFRLTEGLGDEDVVRDADRLRALRQWGADAITCTVDTVLGLLQDQRKGLYAWPGLARSAVVFDEIHAFDDAMFGLLLAWLRNLPGVPVLLMTASLPNSRLLALRKVVSEVHGETLSEIEGPADLEQLPRYRCSDVDSIAAARKALDEGGKVLWVSNTVKRCLDAKDGFDVHRPGLLYHSRFRYCDRVERHREVIDTFRMEGPALAFTTQVAEMSLDLSADLLVTELAPIPALIQRLGRLNRRATPESPAKPKPFVVVEPARPEPYEPDDLSAARDWLNRLGKGEVSQRDLLDAWKDTLHKTTTPTKCALFSEAYATVPKEVRLASQGITIVLERDVDRVSRGEVDVTEVAVPMNSPPRGTKLAEWRRVEYHPVAPARAISYDERSGARWT